MLDQDLAMSKEFSGSKSLFKRLQQRRAACAGVKSEIMFEV